MKTLKNTIREISLVKQIDIYLTECSFGEFEVHVSGGEIVDSFSNPSDIKENMTHSEYQSFKNEFEELLKSKRWR